MSTIEGFAVDERSEGLAADPGSERAELLASRNLDLFEPS